MTSYGGSSLPLHVENYWALPTFQQDYAMSLGMFGGGQRFFRAGPALFSQIYSLDDILTLEIPASTPALVRGAVHQQNHLYKPELFSGD